MSRALQGRRVLLVAAVLAAGLLLAPSQSPRASAYISGCDTDPVLVLSNGMTLALTTHINDSAGDINAIVYTVHAPAGVSLDRVHSWGRLRRVETLLYFADNAAHTYGTHTVVTAGVDGVGVTATATLKWGDDVVASGSATGQGGQDLYVELTY